MASSLFSEKPEWHDVIGRKAAYICTFRWKDILVKGHFGELWLVEDVAYILLTLMLTLMHANPNAMDENNEIVW